LENECSARNIQEADGRAVARRVSGDVSVRRFDLDYKKWPKGATRPKHVYAVAYNLTVMHGLSEKWPLLGFLTPGLSSDFKIDFSSDDSIFQTVLVFIRKYSEKLSIGYGLAYANTFGQPFPFPILALELNNGSNLKLSTILPVNSELWNLANQRLELGLSVKVERNQYHGDPDIYNAAAPLMRYAVGTFGPSARFRISKGLSLGIDSGITFLRRFEFFDGDNNEEVSDYKIVTFDRRNAHESNCTYKIRTTGCSST
jgi:hypothetical protein